MNSYLVKNGINIKESYLNFVANNSQDGKYLCLNVEFLEIRLSLFVELMCKKNDWRKQMSTSWRMTLV